MIIDNKPFRSLTGQLENTYKEKKLLLDWKMLEIILTGVSLL